MAYSGIIHFHSQYSYDALTTIDTIARRAASERLDFLMLTDHDTVAGSLALRRRIQELGLAIEVPGAAEYKTSHGDVIAAFIEREIVARELDAFVAEVRAQGGLLLLPHPFAHHRDVERIARECDLIETFNPRVDAEGNRQAVELAQRLGTPGYAGADAHLSWNLTDTVITVEQRTDLRTSLLTGEIRTRSCKSSLWIEIMASQCIKAAKRRDARLMLQLSARLATTGVLHRKLFRRV